MPKLKIVVHDFDLKINLLPQKMTLQCITTIWQAIPMYSSYSN